MPIIAAMSGKPLGINRRIQANLPGISL